MRIGFDAKRIFHNRSGLGNYSRDLVRMLAQYYPQHQYILYNPKPAKINFPLAPSCSMVIPHLPFHKMFSGLWRRKWILQQLKQDGIHLYHGLSNELPTGLASAGIPTIVSIHDLIFFKYPQWYRPADRIIHQLKVKQAARDASHIVAISHQTKKDILTYLPVSDDKVSVIYQGCHEAFKQKYNAEQKEAVQKTFNLPPQFILSVGTIEPRKNLLTTVKSLLHHPLPLVVIGKKTAYYKAIENFIAQHQLQQRVFFLSDVNMQQLAIVYQLAFAFCYPSIYEGFGIPIIEALFSGTPVISNIEGCFAEAGGPQSFYISCFDAPAMAKVIHELLQDAALYQHTVAAGMDYARQFMDEPIAGQWAQLYERFALK